MNHLALTIILEARHIEIVLYESFIAGFAKYAKIKSMEILFRTLSNDHLLTENVLQSAACNPWGTGAMRQILRHQEYRAKVSDSVLVRFHSLSVDKVVAQAMGYLEPATRQAVLRRRPEFQAPDDIFIKACDDLPKLLILL